MLCTIGNWWQRLGGHVQRHARACALPAARRMGRRQPTGGRSLCPAIISSRIAPAHPPQHAARPRQSSGRRWRAGPLAAPRQRGQRPWVTSATSGQPMPPPSPSQPGAERRRRRPTPRLCRPALRSPPSRAAACQWRRRPLKPLEMRWGALGELRSLAGDPAAANGRQIQSHMPNLGTPASPPQGHLPDALSLSPPPLAAQAGAAAGRG